MTGRTPSRCAARALALLGMLAAVAGCVTETRSGRRIPPAGARQSPSAPAPELPDGPVASPAPGLTSSSRVQVQVAVLGGVRYDGQVLPLVSPDGRFIAVQEGDPPTWDTLLAERGATPPRSTRIAVYDASSSPLRRVDPAEPPSPGLLLGRGVDHQGFLVECPRDNGSRWIGRVEWVSQRLTWLVQSGAVNAHATFTPSGVLLFTRRAVGGEYAELVARPVTGAETTVGLPDESYAFPMATADPRFVYSLVRSTSGTDICALRFDPAAGLGAPAARRNLAATAEPAMAYQIAAPTPPGAPARPDPVAGESVPADPLVIFSPRLARMAVFDPRAGTILPLAPRSIAAAHAPAGVDQDGYFCSTPEGLVFSPAPSPDDASPDPARRRPDVRVLATPYVARATVDPERPLILFGPDARDPERLQVLSLRFVAPEPPAP